MSWPFHIIFISLLIFIQFHLAFPLMAQEQEALNIELLNPTQTDIGDDQAQLKEKTWFLKWYLANKENWIVGVTTVAQLQESYWQYLMHMAQEKSIPIMRDDEGKIFLLDHHHHIRSLIYGQERLQKLQTIGDLVIPCTGYPYMHTLGHEGQAAAIQQREITIPLTQLQVQDNPVPLIAQGQVARVNQLSDNPVRSLIGMTFHEFDLKGSYFTPYVQFAVAQRLLARVKEGQLLLPATTELANPRELKKFLWRILFGDEATVNILVLSLKEGIEIEGKLGEKWIKKWQAKIPDSWTEKALMTAPTPEEFDYKWEMKILKNEYILKSINKLRNLGP